MKLSWLNDAVLGSSVLTQRIIPHYWEIQEQQVLEKNLNALREEKTGDTRELGACYIRLVRLEDNTEAPKAQGVMPSLNF